MSDRGLAKKVTTSDRLSGTDWCDRQREKIGKLTREERGGLYGKRIETDKSRMGRDLRVRLGVKRSLGRGF